MTLPDLNKEMSVFSLGRIILCQKPLQRKGFCFFYSAYSISPNKYKQGEIKTQNA